MKRILVILSALLISAASVMAQDIITKKNGEDIKAKVMEVDNSNVKYKLFDEPDGVTYTLRKSDILMIRYQSGRNEVFNTASTPFYGYGNDREPIENLRLGMKYKELKHYYHPSQYISGFGDRYNPALMGVCSWIVPGLGQAISGEVGRGIGYFVGMMGCSVLAGIGAGLSSVNADDEETIVAGSILSLFASIGILTVDICAIVDAVKVAKVKNMYEQDLRKMNYSLNLYPSVNYVRQPNGVQPTAGFTLAMNF
ncbi:MAG: hypothetical protein J6A22_00320 [Bacteroidales bacterium]|nr:hypothetical protein [Bacteroidales bacterium]